MIPSEGQHEVHVLSFRADLVDGVDVLVLRGSKSRIEHREWRPIEGLETKVIAEFPRETGYRVVVRNREGRPKVRVTQQPAEANGWEARLLIDDGPAAGAAALSFDLYAAPAGKAPVAGHPYNVVLITIDTLRPDRLGCYGYERETSPRLDEFARQAVRFTNAFSTSSFTPPSHASLLTSRYVGDHGLLTWNGLPDEQLTLAELLAAYGYETGASVNINLLTGQNLGQGFTWQREAHRDGREVVSDALKYIRRTTPPFFLWIHLYDVHRPYARVPGWRGRFNSYERPTVGDDEEHYNITPDELRQLGLSEADLAYICDRYDAGIRYADAQLGPLLAELSTPTRAADTLVVVTADHGESLLDHREHLFTHDPFLFASVTRIPLLVRYPRGRDAGRTSDALVSLIDVAPTILDTLGIKPPGSFAGLSLAAMPRVANRPRREIFMECWGWEQLKAVRSADWLVIHDAKRQINVRYDLTQDPTEQQAVSSALPDAVQELEQRLMAFVGRETAADQPPPLDAEVLEQLRSLGYVD